MTKTFEAASGIQAIDSLMCGRAQVTSCYLLEADQPTLVETGPTTSVEAVRAGLESLGVGPGDLAHIVVTHIHLDHAGGAGTLAARFPEAKVAVHPVGAPHLVDPSKLWSSAARIYGERMDELWGGIDPLPEDRVAVLEDGDKIDLGGRSLQAIETPGHAYHHHAYLDDATGSLFCGDALGVRLPEVGVVRPATPPPEFHLAKAVASIERIKQVGASSLWLTHFGPHVRGERTLPVADFCDEAIEALRRWESWVRAARAQTAELDEAAGLVRSQAVSHLEATLDQAAIDRMEQTTSYWMNTWGYLRYLEKNEPAA